MIEFYSSKMFSDIQNAENWIPLKEPKLKTYNFEDFMLNSYPRIFGTITESFLEKNSPNSSLMMAQLGLGK